ncbi:carboxypeptidase regulatory-like domain-containing protein [Paraburkholderia sp. CNPSo 3274]|uniref:carboxypeptidase regulatory-like domain-containing protein n=1 Tax=Paraburkholderia sp. CNPSo 3274 TaxID=2940932 RepID=UPI0020B7C3C4|nr:carboxypeptidase regulatory-like domain-containing protein [Paraburkholderia sp. CNPSo 3274]MCP3710097.1 carboxypeptidase regulatory-like domain-containing protein [Paraburkholderia sp. CNPSo 3274]
MICIRSDDAGRGMLSLWQKSPLLTRGQIHELAHGLTLTVVLVATTSLGASFCEAQTAAAGTDTAATRTVQNGVAYITGGVGSDEAAALRSVAGQYSLRMTFLTRGGEFLSDVDVEIVGPSGAAVLNTRTLGTFLYVSLPAGRYQIAAYAEGTRQTRVVLVNACQGTNVQFDFPALVRRATAPCCRPLPVTQ